MESAIGYKSVQLLDIPVFVACNDLSFDANHPIEIAASNEVRGACHLAEDVRNNNWTGRKTGLYAWQVAFVSVYADECIGLAGKLLTFCTL